MEIPDEVRRELEIRAPRARVWEALTEPNQLLQWFPTKRAEIDQAAGRRRPVGVGRGESGSGG